MAQQLSFRVRGHPPAKNEALSMLGARHPHAERVVRLLEAARAAAGRSGFGGFGSRPLALELLVSCPRDASRSDATNYLGGVGDVLEAKRHRGSLKHLGELAGVALYDNDRQIELVTYRWEAAADPSYTVRIWSLDEQAAAGGGERRDADDLSASGVGDDFTRARLEQAGFAGWLTFAELRRAGAGAVPVTGGVYIVWRAAASEPEFLPVNPGGRFKHRDPTVSQGVLRANWTAGAEVLYVGKANSLRRRLGELERFGAGAPIGHWGGRLIWQLANPADLRVAWKDTPGRRPDEVESELLAAFRNCHGKPPFANDPHLLGR